MMSPNATLTVHSGFVKEYHRRQATARADDSEIPRLEVENCIKMILEATMYNPAAIIIDAVDKIPPTCPHTLLSALARIVQTSASVVKVFVTSRDDYNIRALLPDAMKLRIESHHAKLDMSAYVQGAVHLATQDCRLLNRDVSHQLKEDIIQRLTSCG